MRRKKPKPLGMIDPRCRYTAAGLLKKAGLGRASLMAARATGIVKAIPVGRDVWYRGREIIAWIDSHESK